MAKIELRKAIDSLMKEKNDIDKQLTRINDGFQAKHEELGRLRADQHSMREAKETLSNSNSSKPAKRVFEQQISSAQLRVNEILKEVDQLEKDRVVWSSKVKAIEKSIKELQNA